MPKNIVVGKGTDFGELALKCDFFAFFFTFFSIGTIILLQNKRRIAVNLGDRDAVHA